MFHWNIKYAKCKHVKTKAYKEGLFGKQCRDISISNHKIIDLAEAHLSPLTVGENIWIALLTY